MKDIRHAMDRMEIDTLTDFFRLAAKLLVEVSKKNKVINYTKYLAERCDGKNINRYYHNPPRKYQGFIGGLRRNSYVYRAMEKKKQDIEMYWAAKRAEKKENS